MSSDSSSSILAASMSDDVDLFRMLKKDSKCKSNRGVRVYLLTWNVSGKKPPVAMEDMLNLTSTPLPDVYGIGLQEVKPNSSDVQVWVDALTALLVQYNYVRVKYRQMFGLLTLVFVGRCVLPFCTSFESEATKTGFGGWFGNKGGASIRLDLYGVNLIIVNCHLAAHQPNVADRIMDYDGILDDQKFKDLDVENILDHDYVFWLGDLNFRVDNMTRQEILKAIQAKQFNRLLDNDQLNRCREERLLLEGFYEMPITFPPSFKFDIGTNTYDTSPKQRMPAYCDRILWHMYDIAYDCFHLNVLPLEYKSHMKYVTSDHKPISATVIITVFPKPPLNPVQFEHQKDWKMNEPHMVYYHVNRHAKTCSSDWIGLFKANFADFYDYVTYIYGVEGAEKKKNRKEGMVLKFSLESMIIAPGDYCLCYMTKKYSLMGITNVFKIY